MWRGKRDNGSYSEGLHTQRGFHPAESEDQRVLHTSTVNMELGGDSLSTSEDMSVLVPA